MCENMQEVLTKIEQVETKIVDKIDSLSGAFQKQEGLQMKLYDQNKIRIDNLTKTTDSMKKEYREKFIKLEKKLFIISVVLLSVYLIGAILNVFL
jgi:hypothetical protein